MICIGVIIGISFSFYRFSQDRHPPDPTHVIKTSFEFGRVQISPNFTKIAFSPFRVYSHEGRRYIERGREVYVYDIPKQTVIRLFQLTENKRISELIWQRDTENPTLWVSRMGEFWGRDFEPRYFVYEITFDDESIIPNSIQTYNDPVIVYGFHRNLGGNILLGNPKTLTTPKYALHGIIAVSFDKGQNALYYEGIQGYRIFWENDYVFLTEDSESKRILKFQITPEEIVKKGIVHEGNDILLCGLIDGACVYRLDDYHIYVGENKIYTANDPIGYIQVSDPFIAFRENNEIISMDLSGTILNRITLDHDFVVLDIDAVNEKCYLIYRNSIAVWNFSKGDGIEQILDISIILGSKS